VKKSKPTISAASPAYRIIDKRNSGVSYGSNTLIEAATQTGDREYTPPLTHDIHRTVSSMGRQTLVTLGRKMFWKFPALQGMVLEQANLAVSTFIPQYAGRNKEWGKLAEPALNEWHKVMDISGWPYDYDSYLQSLVIGPIVEGETATLLTENAEGYPLVQTIPQHRIGKYQTKDEALVTYSGTSLYIDGIEVDSNRPYPAAGTITFVARIIDGVIVDDYCRPIAYRVDGELPDQYQDIAARNMFLAFTPLATGQVRGFSMLASSIFDWQDLAEWKRFEMLAQKVFSTRTIIETNETGDVDEAKSIIKTAATFDSNGNKTDLDVQRLYGGTIQYLRAKTGSKVEAFGYDRPGNNSREFLKTTLRDAFRGTEWDAFFSLDPQAVGGAPMRIIVEKINLVAAKRRKLVRKCCARVDGYAISKMMKLGLLPWDDDWYRWDYQGPGDVTADKKYDCDVDLDEISQGIGTRKESCAKRGRYLEDVDAQRETEADSELTRAGRLAKKHGITIQEALVVLRPPSRNAQMPQAPAAQEDPSQPEQPISEQ
jgi:hypothetical protein